MQQKLDKCAYNVASEGGKRNNNFPLIIIHSYSRMGVQRQQCLATFLLPAQCLPRSERT